MPIGTTAAIIGAAAIGAGGSAIAASQNKSAIKSSTDASLQANRESIAAQERANQQALAFQQNALDQAIGFQTGQYNSSGQLQTDIYNRNSANFNPYLATGEAANSRINAMLGLDTSGYTPQAPVQFTQLGNSPEAPPVAGENSQSANGGTPSNNNIEPDPVKLGVPNIAVDPNSLDIGQLNALAAAYANGPIPLYARGTNYHPGGPAIVGEQGPELVNLPAGSQVIPNHAFYGPAVAQARRDARIASRPPRPNGGGTGATGNTGGAGSGSGGGSGGTPLSPQDQALNSFYNTPLYQFPLDQGLQAINANYAARGMLESGAAQKSLLNYAQGVAGGALGDYFQLLGNQQGLGFSAASANSGVSQGYANNLTGIGQNAANALSGASSTFANNAGNLAVGLGNAYSQGAYNTSNALSNAAIANANNSNALVSGLGNAFGGIGGALAYKPYAGGPSAGLVANVSNAMAANPGIF